jgi:hypothetical protein
MRLLTLPLSGGFCAPRADRGVVKLTIIVANEIRGDMAAREDEMAMSVLLRHRIWLQCLNIQARLRNDRLVALHRAVVDSVTLALKFF